MVIAGDGDSCSSGCWDFSPGDRIRDEARFRFHSPVHYSRFYSNQPFALVVDFPRSSFRLCCSSVALALRACIGGSPHDFHVSHLSGRCYSFLLCSKQVGLWIYNLKSFTCKDYVARFFLWHDGGPKWRREFDLWSAAEEAEWTVVSHKNSPSKQALSNPSRKQIPSRGKALVPVKSVFDRLSSALPVISTVVKNKKVVNVDKPMIAPKTFPVITGGDLESKVVFHGALTAGFSGISKSGAVGDKGKCIIDDPLKAPISGTDILKGSLP